MGRPTVGSVFSGIGGFDLGLERAGWQVRWQIENNPWRQERLREHWPEVELRTDVRTDTDGLDRVDLVCGGFPCTDLSVAGKRAGLAGEQSSLWYEFVRLVEDTRPTWVLVENVPGLLSSHQGKDFAIVIGGLAERGFGVAWRVLDSRYFGVAQRRRRVFIAGRSGRPCPLEVLFEPESGGRDSEAGRTSRIQVARALRASPPDSDPDYDTCIVNGRQDPIVGKQPLDGNSRSLAVAQRVSGTVTGAEAHNGNSRPIPDNYVVNARQSPIVGLQPLDGDGHSLAVVTRDGSDSNPSSATNGGSSGIVVSAEADADGVREAPGLPGRMDNADAYDRETTEYWERELAGPDGPRYAALGDAVTVPVIEWIGRRMLAVHRRRP